MLFAILKFLLENLRCVEAGEKAITMNSLAVQAGGFSLLETPPGVMRMPSRVKRDSQCQLIFLCYRRYNAF